MSWVLSANQWVPIENAVQFVKLCCCNQYSTSALCVYTFVLAVHWTVFIVLGPLPVECDTNGTHIALSVNGPNCTGALDLLMFT